MKNRLKRLTGIIGALLIAVSPCGSQTMAYASEPAETEAAFYDDGADFEIQEDTAEQVQDQEGRILQKRKKIRIQQIFRSKKTQRMQTVKIRS